MYVCFCSSINFLCFVDSLFLIACKSLEVIGFCEVKLGQDMWLVIFMLQVMYL